jgi:hypothetical protein
LSTATLAPPAPSPRMQVLRHAARWDRLMERRLQNTEIQTLIHQIARELKLIALDPDITAASRAAAERALELTDKALEVEAQDVKRDEAEGHELNLLGRELAAFRKPRAWRPGEEA